MGITASANLALLLTGVVLSQPASALIIETSVLENAYIEALPEETLGNGGISVVSQFDAEIDSVARSDPTSFRSPGESDDELRTRDRSAIVSVRHKVHIGGLEIDVSPGRIFVLDPESGEITFGDGEQGARPPDGESTVSTYRVGAGASGTIGKSFILNTEDLRPFLIPLLDFSTDSQGQPEFRFILSGISAIDLFPTELGLLVSGIQPARIPEPGTLGLLVIGLSGIRILGRRRLTAR